MPVREIGIVAVVIAGVAYGNAVWEWSTTPLSLLTDLLLVLAIVLCTAGSLSVRHGRTLYIVNLLVCGAGMYLRWAPILWP